jgi:type I restriction enzyme S subunit
VKSRSHRQIQETTIGAICDRFGGDVQTGPFGSQLHAADYARDGIPVVMPQDMVDGRIETTKIARVAESHAFRLSQHRIQTGDVVYSRRGDVGRFAVVTDIESGWLCGTGSIRIRLNCREIDIRYLRRYLQQGCVVAWLEHNAKGVTMPNLNTAIILKLPIFYPPLTAQRRIAAILDEADALRSKRRTALAHLDEVAKAIFLEMFGDPAVNPRGFPSTFLSDLVRPGDSINYGVIQPGDAFENGVPLIRVGDLVGGRVRHGNLKRISPEIDAVYKRSRLQGDEILISCVGTIGMVALVRPEERNFIIARAVARVRVGNRVNREFVAAYLGTDYVQNYFESELRTVSQPTLNIKQIGETPIFIPPLSLQTQFVTRLTALERIRVPIIQSAAHLEDLFAALQHRAFSGEV